MKRKFLLSILAAVSAAFLPLAATSQIAPDRPPSPPKAAPAYKYEIAAGYGYTSINQINQSRYGLQGVNLSVTRDWGRYFGVTADGAFYNYALLQNSSDPNPGSPSVDLVLFGPVLHAHLVGKVDCLFHVLLGGAHTGGESASPSISFAGGAGGGLEYKLNQHFALRATGDDIASSFLANDNTAVCSAGDGCSPHERRNSRAAFSLVYKF
ncbi:MAG: hypothetical protein ABSG00_02175 [Terracidiphilus sp.]